MYQRRLPHIQRPGATYFITWRLRPPQPDLNPEERSRVADALHHFNGQRYELLAFVVMNDHVHVLTRPIEPETPASLTHTWKSYTANQLQRTAERRGSKRLWQEESYDHIVRDEVQLQVVIGYISNNPAKRWPSVSRYSWLWVASEVEKGM